MLRPVRFLTPKFVITPEAKKLLSKQHDNPLLFLGVNALETTIVSNSSKLSFWDKVFGSKSGTTKLYTFLDVDKKSNDFVLSMTRKINRLVLKGDTVPVDLSKVALDRNELTKVILNSKKGILNKVNRLQRYLKYQDV